MSCEGKWEGEAPAEPNTSFSSESAGGILNEASGGRRPAVALGSAGASHSHLHFRQRISRIPTLAPSTLQKFLFSLSLKSDIAPFQDVIFEVVNDHCRRAGVFWPQ